MDLEYQSRAAQDLLNNESFKDVMKELREETIAAWANSRADDEDGREEMYYFQLALLHVETRLQAKADNGKIILSKQAKMPNTDEEA